MEKSKRLTPVAHIKRNEERDAVRRLFRDRQEHARDEEKLSELRAFYEDYGARTNSPGGASTSMR
jgi:flagellar biosynthesis chaperone FliJ